MTRIRIYGLKFRKRTCLNEKTCRKRAALRDARLVPPKTSKRNGDH